MRGISSSPSSRGRAWSSGRLDGARPLAPRRGRGCGSPASFGLMRPRGGRTRGWQRVRFGRTMGGVQRSRGRIARRRRSDEGAMARDRSRNRGRRQRRRKAAPGPGSTPTQEWIGAVLHPPVYVDDEAGEPERMALVLWVESSIGLVVAQGFVESGSESEEEALVRILRKGAENVTDGGLPLPERLRVADANAARALRGVLANDPTIVVGPIPEIDEVASQLFAFLGESGEEGATSSRAGFRQTSSGRSSMRSRRCVRPHPGSTPTTRRSSASTCPISGSKGPASRSRGSSISTTASPSSIRSTITGASSMRRSPTSRLSVVPRSTWAPDGSAAVSFARRTCRRRCAASVRPIAGASSTRRVIPASTASSATGRRDRSSPATTRSRRPVHPAWRSSVADTRAR